MSQHKQLGLWVMAGVCGVALLLWSAGSMFPLLPDPWEIDRGQAKLIALERLNDLGAPVDRPYVVVRFFNDIQLERRLQHAAATIDPQLIRASSLAASQLLWDVLVYEEGARPREWTYRALISPAGVVHSLRRREGIAESTESLPDEVVIDRAVEFLSKEGFSVADFESDFLVERDDVGDSDQTVVQFRRHEAVLGDEYPYGLEVFFEGQELLGFGPWYEDPDRDELQDDLRHMQLLSMLQLVLVFVLLPIVALPFLRRYHDGQLGVRRGVQFLLMSLGAGLVFVLIVGSTFSEGTNIGFLTRRQTTWMISGFTLMFEFFGYGVLALMSWSVGESICRQRNAQKLASLDALFRLKWQNSTVAHSALRGVCGGLLMVGLLSAMSAIAPSFGAWALSAFQYSTPLDGPWLWLSVLAVSLCRVLPTLLFVCLLVVSWATDRFGDFGGVVVGAAAMIGFSPVVIALPLHWGWLMWALVAVIPVVLFRYGDLLSALLAGVTATVVLTVLPALLASNPTIEAQGWLAVLVVALPMLASLRHLGGGQEFVYTYDDVPPHVRRIAERERQRVELETARNIQSSILPELPPQLNGVEIAHSYLPATEVGGDFYDVLALEDGRLAVAVGDVAGHGVSSGLVMSMAKSALAVQVSFEPEVEAVFTTLNRMVYQSARRRLLSTLCYAIVDPSSGEFFYASAGHVFPYRVAAEGEVEPFMSDSYPLGVRSDLKVRVRGGRLQPGDSIFMYSDGLVEACPEGSDEPFGFDRLEDSLERYSSSSPAALRDFVLGDVADYTGGGLREDDLTVLVLRMPA